MTQDSLKTKIFNSAWQIVETEGMDRLTVTGIAELSSCSLGAVYSVFDNFQDLQLRINAGILSTLFTIFNKTVEKALKKHKSFKELLKALAFAYIEFGQKHSFLWKAVFEHLPTAPFPFWYAKHSHEEAYLLSKKLAKTFQIPELEIKRILSFFWASIHGICSILLNKKLETINEFFSADIHLSPYIDYCLEGLFPQELKPQKGHLSMETSSNDLIRK